MIVCSRCGGNHARSECRLEPRNITAADAERILAPDDPLRKPTNNVTDFPTRDLIKEMTGPENGGNSVIIEGRLMPHVAMYDRGDTIDFVIDHRLSFPFPREHAYQAASFAFAAMSVAAGFRHFTGLHYTQHEYASKCVKLGDIP